MKLTTKELGKYLRMSTTTVYRLINNGKIPFYIMKRGKHRKDKYFDLDEVKKILGINS